MKRIDPNILSPFLHFRRSCRAGITERKHRLYITGILDAKTEALVNGNVAITGKGLYLFENGYKQMSDEEQKKAKYSFEVEKGVTEYSGALVSKKLPGIALKPDLSGFVTKYDDTSIEYEMVWDGYNTTASGGYSHSEGRETTASGSDSHAEGQQTKAKGSSSHAEGANTTASGSNSHAEGGSTTASNYCCHAEGFYTTASGYESHAEGCETTASGYDSHAEGSYTTATNHSSHAGGHYNASMTDGGSSNNTTGTAFAIGNGTSKTAKSNAFSVQFDGTVKAKSTITASTTADYAEFFEWLDGNPDDEDRVGYFVTLDGDKIRIATAADDYILGVVSGEPFVLGNGDCDTWNGMFLRDEFRRTIFEPAPKMVEILDSEGNPTGEYEEVEGEFEGTRPKLNPEYDHTQKYISRFERKEWAPVGMLGVLAVRHDGTAVVNGYVTVNADGIATACEKGAENAYRVIKSNTDYVVEIIFR